jgi:DNA repair exonuclease SbcCD ATPase subunit
MSEHIKDLLAHLKREWVNMPNYKMSWVSDSLVELEYKDTEIASLKEEVDDGINDIKELAAEVRNARTENERLKEGVERLDKAFNAALKQRNDLFTENTALHEKVERLAGQLEHIKGSLANVTLNSRRNTDWYEKENTALREKVERILTWTEKRGLILFEVDRIEFDQVIAGEESERVMTRDQFICEDILHKCWHEWTGKDSLKARARRGDGRQCKKCKVAIDDASRHDNPSFSTSHAYELQQFVLRADWWPGFELFVWATKWRKLKNQPMPDAGYIKWLFSDASRFADLVVAFDKMRKGKPEGGSDGTA